MLIFFFLFIQKFLSNPYYYPIACVFLRVPYSPRVNYNTKSKKKNEKNRHTQIAFRLPLLGKHSLVFTIGGLKIVLHIWRCQDRLTVSEWLVIGLCQILHIPWLDPCEQWLIVALSTSSPWLECRIPFSSYGGKKSLWN